ncbi:MAG: hypothetical protein ABR564_07985 [Candidatus Dormibacteria bacterium]
MAIPNPLIVAAENEAVRRGYGYIGGHEVLLALLSGSPDDLAQRALNSVGITYQPYSDRFDEFLATCYPPSRPPDPNVTVAKPNSATRQLFGRAEGFAARSGVESVRSEHGLLAWLWEPGGNSVVELEQLSTSAEHLLEALSALGVNPPPLELPQPDRTPRGEMVFLPPERLSDVIAELQKLQLPPGSWGFNTYQDRAWVRGYAHIDLQAVVDRVLATASAPAP